MPAFSHTHTPHPLFQIRASGSRASMVQLPPEIIEQILIRLEVRDLIRYRSVSNSWKSLISDSDFIKTHLENSYRRDRENDEVGNRRIITSSMPCGYWLYDADNINFVRRTTFLLGSSNGLVCVSPSRTSFLLINPEIRGVKKLKNPKIPKEEYMIYGFGYDSSKDDYKVVLGFRKGSSATSFLMFSLKSDTWEGIGEVNYTFVSRAGLLYNGALHWVVCHGAACTEQHVILSLDLSEDKFEEIPQPCKWATGLGTMDGCLCVFSDIPVKVWVLNESNVRQSWELVETVHKIKPVVVHRLKDLKHYIPNKRSLCQKEFVNHTPEFTGAMMYTPSLVSPHVCRELNNKRQETSISKSRKVLKLCDVPAGSSEVGNLGS